MAQQPPDANPVTWRVTSQQETTQPGANGTYTKGVIVYFVMGGGESGSVFVPNGQYNADNVKGLIAARAAQLAAVSALESD